MRDDKDASTINSWQMTIQDQELGEQRSGLTAPRHSKQVKGSHIANEASPLLVERLPCWQKNAFCIGDVVKRRVKDRRHTRWLE
ncbi:hypothetical protein D3C85_1742780 [compost metagenome]